MNANNALELLRAGNRRFVRSLSTADVSHARRDALAEGQAPKVIVLACADSRVPPELVFDLGLGELFVVRVAGNVCAPSTIGSIEYAASVLGTELVVVLGHTRCGAVKATTDAMITGKRPCSPHLDDMVERIAPALSGVVHAGRCPDAMLADATRANVVHVADRLGRESDALAERIASGKLTVVSAEYALESGEVSFFDTPVALDSAA